MNTPPFWRWLSKEGPQVRGIFNSASSSQKKCRSEPTFNPYDTPFSQTSHSHSLSLSLSLIIIVVFFTNTNSPSYTLLILFPSTHLPSSTSTSTSTSFPYTSLPLLPPLLPHPHSFISSLTNSSRVWVWVLPISFKTSHTLSTSPHLYNLFTIQIPST